jgi:hypothetical protein
VLEVHLKVCEVVVDQAVQAELLRKPAELLAAVVVVAVLVPLAAVQEGVALCVLFIPATHGLIQPLTRGICNGTLYSN